MGAFTPIEEPLPPPAQVLLPLEAFAETWKGRPNAPVLMGLRHVAMGVEETARAEAAKWAVEMHPTPGELQIESYNDFLMRWIISCAACHPSDLSRDFFAFAQDTVRDALTSQGVQLIWERYETMLLETSPLDAALEDEEVGELIALLEADRLNGLTTSYARRVRRLLRSVLTDLRLVE